MKAEERLQYLFKIILEDNNLKVQKGLNDELSTIVQLIKEETIEQFLLNQ